MFFIEEIFSYDFIIRVYVSVREFNCDDGDGFVDKWERLDRSIRVRDFLCGK